jgi:small subunit ribosomal protein S18
MARDKKKKSQAADRRRPIKKKTSILSTESIDWVDYKDVNLLRRFMSERAKIRARRVTGNSAQQQRAVARAIRIAREMALLPYSVRQVTQRSRGGRRDRGDRDRGDRGDRGDRDRPLAPPPSREAAAPAADDAGASAPAEGGNGVETPAEVTAEATAPAPVGGEDQS